MMIESRNVPLIPTGIRGLDLLLHGGVRPLGDLAPIVLIQGPSGSGKTTLSSQIAIGASYATGLPSLIFLLEEEPGNYTAHLHEVHRLDGFEIFDAYRYTSEPSRRTGPGLIVGSLPSTDYSTCFTFLAEQMGMMTEGNSPRFASVVLDGLAAFTSFQRDQFLQMCRSCQAHAHVIAATAGQPHPHVAAANDLAYASDIVLRLGYAEHGTAGDPYFVRYLELEKCRHQPHFRGRHRCSIFACNFQANRNSIASPYLPHGFEVFPSASARLSSYVGRAPRRDYAHRVRFGVSGLDALISSGNDEQHRGMVQGSTCLLVGERATSKFEFALHFVAEGLRCHEQCLVITFRRDSQMVQALASSYTALEGIAERLSAETENEHLQFYALRPSHIDAGQFLSYLSSILEADGKKGCAKYRRVVIDDLSALQHGFPLLSGDPLFLPALVQYMSSLDCTTVFTDTIPDTHLDLHEVHSRLIDTVDYIVIAQHLVFTGQDHTVVTVRRSPDGTHDTTVAEVCRSLCDGRSRIDVDTSAFVGLTGILDKKPEPVEVFVRLVYENDAQQQFNEVLKERVEGVRHKSSVIVSSVPFSHVERGDFSRLRRFSPESPLSAIRAISMDTYWIRWAAKSGLLEDITGGIPDDVLDEFLAVALEPCMIRTESHHQVYALPQYLDLGLFCRRLPVKPGMAVLPSTPLDWSEMRKFASSGKTYRHLLAFDMECDDSLVCTFIELVLNSGVHEQALLDRVSTSSSSTSMHWDSFKPSAIEVLGQLRRLVEEGHLPFPCTLAHCRNALFTRTWYSTLRGAFENPSGTSNQADALQFEYCNYPTLGAPSGNKTFVCAGTWYLGLLAGSIWPSIGIEILNEITSLKVNIQRAKASAGIPAKRGFYDLYRKQPLGSVSTDGPVVQNLPYGDIEQAFYRERTGRLCVVNRECVFGIPAAAFSEVVYPIARQIRGVLSGHLPPVDAVTNIGNYIACHRETTCR